MKYYLHTSHIDKRQNNLSVEDFFDRLYKEYSKSDYYQGGSAEEKEMRIFSLRNLIISEYLWVKAGKPCYKVPLETIEHFSKTPLNIPIKDFLMPYNSFLVRFPIENGIEAVQYGKTTTIRTALFFRIGEYLGIVCHLCNENSEVSDRPVLFVGKIQNENQTIEQIIPDMGLNNKDTTFTSEILSFLTRVCVGVALFSTNTHFKAQFDNLEILAEKCHGTKKQRILKMAEKTKNEGTIVLFQRDLNIFNDMIKTKTVGTTRGELKYKHIRATYIRRQRFGPGKQFIKTVIIPQTVVRPDLPSRQYA